MKSALIFVLFCFLGSVVFSQNIVIKPAVGINVTNFSKNPSNGKFTGQVGWQIGGSVAFGRKFYVEPGVFYGQQSTQYTDNTTSADDLTFDISGVQIPVTIGYNLIGNEKGIFNIRVFGGGSVFIVTNVNQGEKSAYTSPTWGVFAGTGVDFLIFFIDLKYQWSLTNVSENTYEVGKSQTFLVNFGAKIPI
jgi:hypothetical protein